jgi:hypothetical protein
VVGIEKSAGALGHSLMILKEYFLYIHLIAFVFYFLIKEGIQWWMEIIFSFVLALDGGLSITYISK